MFIYFSDEGDTLTKSYFVGKKTVGVLKQWYQDGHLKSVAVYNNSGKKHGLSETWNEDGTRKDSTVWDNGNIIELRTYFYNGKVRYWIKKVDSTTVKTLEAVYYDIDGKKCGEVKNGNGTFISWADDASRGWLKTYKDGEEVSSRKIKPDENPDF